MSTLTIIPAQEGQAHPVILTPEAARQAIGFAEQAGQQQWLLRLGVRSGGCTGFKYELSLVEQAEERDHLSTQHGVQVAVDGESVAYLQGTVLDFKQTLTESGFQFENPRAVAACGCGSSFRMDDEPPCGEPESAL